MEGLVTDIEASVYRLLLYDYLFVAQTVLFTIYRPTSQIIEAQLSNSFDKDTQVHIGDVVTCSFTNISPNGNPVMPQIERIRLDAAWEQLIDNSIKYNYGILSIYGFNNLTFV